MGVRSGEDTRYFRGNKEKVWKEILQTLSERKFSIRSINEGAGEIEASSGLSFLSSGARLNILVTPVNRETTRVRVSGKAKGITLIDYGRSAREAGAVLAGLEERIPSVDLRMELEEEAPSPGRKETSSEKTPGAFCSQCGAPLEEGARFCGNCGNPVEK
ncbi:MAG TPA: zinc ribbon domain-containing protein [Synergistaceae bacterium]|nr:zinc ribbon domain-containing protein [Synergistaceae bacterium]HPJ26327.1 zinc ribbon domain-containing protein [Synergistaceae bacterium]HPQ37765.1 zinc ribbon domain-containing protein [Synergistaceae bacterium]